MAVLMMLLQLLLLLALVVLGKRYLALEVRGQLLLLLLQREKAQTPPVQADTCAKQFAFKPYLLSPSHPEQDRVQVLQHKLTHRPDLFAYRRCGTHQPKRGVIQGA